MIKKAAKARTLFHGVAMGFMGIVGILTLLVIGNSVPTDLTEDDISTFASPPYSFKRNRDFQTFDSEIKAIQEVQHAVFRAAPLRAPIPEFSPREPLDLLKNRSGLCFDRSRTLEKALRYEGFETRHVFLLFSRGRTAIDAVFAKRHPSHAVSEVKTSRGWLLVDSNTEWIALSRNGEPVGADDLKARRDEFDEFPPYFSESGWAIRGLYSRRGQFYQGWFYFPELNVRDFLSWIIYG